VFLGYRKEKVCRGKKEKETIQFNARGGEVQKRESPKIFTGPGNSEEARKEKELEEE